MTNFSTAEIIRTCNLISAHFWTICIAGCRKWLTVSDCECHFYDIGHSKAQRLVKLSGIIFNMKESTFERLILGLIKSISENLYDA